MIERTQYLDELKSFQNKQVIKVITGIRRCGKSTLMSQFQSYLKTQGIKDEQFININFEDLEFENLKTYKDLYDYILAKLNTNEFTYIFLDEVQKVVDFQKAVDSLYIKPNIDIYITGSNSNLLSSELSTLLTGRYIEIKMLPLSFKEYCSAFGKEIDKNKLFSDYMQNGGMPYSLEMKDNKAKQTYLEGIFNTIVNIDIIKRYPKIDIELLENILKYLMSNIGNLVSSSSIANYLTSSKRNTSYNTVENYLSYLKECYLIYEANRYDIKGKQNLKKLAKYYSVDLGIRNILLLNSEPNVGYMLENIVYLELLRRYKKVFVGKIKESEVDFVVEDNDGKAYFQVTASMLNENVYNREVSILKAIKEDNYPKTILTLDIFTIGNDEGIKIVNVIDWLLN
jgi:uncharacterized protein